MMCDRSDSGTNIIGASNMKRVRVYNKEELLYAIKFYRKLKPDSKLKLAEFDFDERVYKQGISVGYDEEENDSVYVFWSKPDDLESISMLGRQRSE